MLPLLQILSVAHTKVAGKSLGELKSLKRLQSLTLSGTLISDEDLATLSELKQLQRLEVVDCVGITTKAVDDLKKALPQCRIAHNADRWRPAQER